MLVLSRHRDEKIRIGDTIEVVVVDIRGDKVRLGIEAPAQIQVSKQEVYEAIHRNNGKLETPLISQKELYFNFQKALDDGKYLEAEHTRARLTETKPSYFELDKLARGLRGLLEK